MNWKLIVLLSLFGLAMGMATVFWIPSKIEPLFWLVIFLLCAVLIARGSARPFLTGLLLGIANSVWITACHILFYGAYIARHAQEAAMMKSMPAAVSPKLMMALTGPLIGVVSGIIIGLFAWVASRLIRRPSPATA